MVRVWCEYGIRLFVFRQIKYHQLELRSHYFVHTSADEAVSESLVTESATRRDTENNGEKGVSGLMKDHG
jgi:hypothetical protein